MSTRKHAPHREPEQALPEPGNGETARPPASYLENVEVKSLELDQQFEVDTDPYNRTGSHFVAALRRKQD